MRTERHDVANSNFPQFCERASQREIILENEEKGKKEETWNAKTCYGMLS
jgi:hypothetical protein